MTKTKIEWTDRVWNPVTGCTKVSQGCKNCYAETIAERFWAKQYPPNADGSPRKFTDVRMHPERLQEPLKWKKPARVFVNSMSDLFHEDVPDGFIDQVFAVMAICKQHTFQILTKRPERVLSWSSNFYGTRRRGWIVPNNSRIASLNISKIQYPDWPLPNVWLGVSVENQKTADERIPLLLQTQAAVKFLSCEPLLGPIQFNQMMPDGDHLKNMGWIAGGEFINWVIAGGESGPHARPMHPDWVRSIRDQCQAAGVPFFFKQWGEWLPVGPLYPKSDDDQDVMENVNLMSSSICFGNMGTVFNEYKSLKELYWCGYQPSPGENPWYFEKVGKKFAGRELDGRIWDEFPEVK
jgi:protein gp37